MDLPADYREAVPFGMNDVRKNRHLLSGVYDSMGRDEMKRFFYADFIGITRKAVGDAQRQAGVCARGIVRSFWHIFVPRRLPDF